jgi:hypothetical protein
VGVLAANRAPGVPGDLEDHAGDPEADQRIGDWQAEGYHGGACDHGQTDVGIRTGVVAIGDQGCAVEGSPGAGTDLRRKPVSAIANHSRPG